MSQYPRSHSLNFKWLEASVAAANAIDCILWPFSRRANGYGQIFYRGKRTSPHRIACEMAYGPPPFPKAEAAHSCLNRLCFNPHHLSWKTHIENSADKVIQGRQPRGEQIYNSKLTTQTVVEIRERLRAGETLTSLAATYGVCFQTISDVKRRKLWKHVA